MRCPGPTRVSGAWTTVQRLAEDPDNAEGLTDARASADPDVGRRCARVVERSRQRAQEGERRPRGLDQDASERQQVGLVAGHGHL